MDNAGAHRDPQVRTTLLKFGAAPVYLPPYSPEFNPIELGWSYLRDYLRQAKARTIDALNNSISWGMALINAEMAQSLYRHCGYTAQPS